MYILKAQYEFFFARDHIFKTITEAKLDDAITEHETMHVLSPSLSLVKYV